MKLEITGNGLTIQNLVAAARSESLKITFAETALLNMKSGRAFADFVALRGDPVYGLSVGVGSRKTRITPREEMVNFNNRMIRDHANAQGPFLPADVTRAAAICLINSISAGRTLIRPELALKFAHRLSKGPPLKGLPVYGGTGVGDVVQLPMLVLDLLDGEQVDVGEALPLIAQSCVVTAHATMAIFDAKTLLNEMCIQSALDIEGYAANPSPYHLFASTLRPFEGYRTAQRCVHACLLGSRLHEESPRHLQAPLSFRTCTVVLGAAYDALHFCENQISIELNAHQQNPLLFHEENRMVTSGHFDMQAVSSALDFARIALAPALNAQTERSIKLLQASETGLTAGLEPWANATASCSNGLSELAWTIQGMCTEARTLIQPVSAETCSSSQAEGIEDRMNMASLSARRLSDMVSLGFRCTTLSAVIASQAIDLREGGAKRLGATLQAVYVKIRSFIATLGNESSPPTAVELEGFLDALKQGLFFEEVQGTLSLLQEQSYSRL
jgi:histidine ammonia-lyase